MVKVQSYKGKVILFYIFLALVLLLFIGIPRISMPLMVAFVLCMILRPIVPVLGKFGIGVDISIVLIFLGLAIFLVYPIMKFAPIIQEEVEKLQYYAPKVEQLVREQYNTFRSNLQDKAGISLPTEYVDNMAVYINEIMGSVVLRIPNALASFLEWLFLVPLFLFFMLREGSAFKRSFLKFIPNAIFEKTYYLVSQFSKQIGSYIFAKFIEAAIIGIIITVGLLFMEVRFAFILGIVAAVTNIIPYLGPVLGSLPGIIVGFIDYGMSPALGAVVALYTIANAIDLALVFPILVSKIVDLHPVIVVVSVIVGSQYLGILGMVVSIPVAASLKLLVEEIFYDAHPYSGR